VCTSSTSKPRQYSIGWCGGPNILRLLAATIIAVHHSILYYKITCCVTFNSVERILERPHVGQHAPFQRSHFVAQGEQFRFLELVPAISACALLIPSAAMKANSSAFFP